MNYKTWNKILCEYFFSQQESQTFLSIDKDTLIDIAIETHEFLSQLKTCEKEHYKAEERRKYAWSDFLHIFLAAPNYMPSKAYLFRLWQKKILETNADYIPSVFPFIALFVIPLSNDPELNANSFYPKVNEFLRKNGIINKDEEIGTRDMAALAPQLLDLMWNNLSEWANANGYEFSVSTRSQTGRARYSQPFLSQLIFTANQRNRFKLMFYQAGLTPAQDIDKDYAIQILSNHCGAIGLSRDRLQILKRDYLQSALSIFYRELDSWDGMALVIPRDSNNGRAEYLGVNQNLLLTVNTSRFGIKFSLKASLLDASFGEEFTYQSKTLGVYSFTTDNKGEADVSIWNNGISHCFDTQSLILFYKQGDRNIKLSYRPADFELLEYLYGSYVSCKKLQPGRRYYALISINKFHEFSDWIAQNSGSLIESHPLSKSYKLVYIESATSDLPTSDIKRLHFEQRKTIELKNTICLGKSDTGAVILYNGLPAFFNIQGVDVLQDNVRAVFNSVGRIEEMPLEFDMESNLWKLPIISNYFMRQKEFQIFCNDTNFPTRYKVSDFNILLDEQYNEINFNHFGEYDEFGELKGLRVPINSDIAWTMLNDRMKKEGSPLPKKNTEYSETDYILYFLSTRPRCLRAELVETINVLIQNNLFKFDSNSKWAVRSLIDNYFRLGYINYSYADSKHIIAVNKPSLLLLPPKVKKERQGRLTVIKHVEAYWTCLFTGARTPDTVARLIKATSSFSYKGNNIVIKIEKTAIALLPQSIFLMSNSIDALQQFALKYGLCFDRCIYSNALCQTIASVEDYFKHKTQFESVDKYDAISSFDVVDYEKLASDGFYSKRHSYDSKSDLVTYFPGTFREQSVLWYNDSQYEVDKHWGHLIAMMLKNNRIICYLENDNLITLPIMLQLPQLYARALTMISGRIPYEVDKTRHYEIYDNPFVHFCNHDSILKKLSQS